jgi:putative signal transducing protein
MDTQSHPAELVEVFDTQEESEAWVVEALLESAGIAALSSGREAPQNVLPGVGGVVVRVAPENAAAARRLIAENRGVPPPEDGASEDPGQQP